jgi:steroid 5-alpha reductase family enzyme
MLTLLLTNFLLAILLMLILWLVSIRIRDVSFIDAFWAWGMVLLTVSSFILTPNGLGERKLLILALVSLWGLRLGLHLFIRWRRSGVDPRYAKILGGLMDKKGWSFGKAALIQVFAMQGPLLFIVCLPAQAGQMASAPELGLLAALGTAVTLIGILFEAVGDAQLNAFRANPANRGTVLDTGLWRYTRHPNYFGDTCTWWGLWLISAEAGAWWTVVGPILLTWLLTRLSGVPMLERALTRSRPGYADYVARTSSFFPLPPKRQG